MKHKKTPLNVEIRIDIWWIIWYKKGFGGTFLEIFFSNCKDEFTFLKTKSSKCCDTFGYQTYLYILEKTTLDS